MSKYCTRTRRPAYDPFAIAHESLRAEYLSDLVHEDYTLHGEVTVATIALIAEEADGLEAAVKKALADGTAEPMSCYQTLCTITLLMDHLADEIVPPETL